MYYVQMEHIFKHFGGFCASNDVCFGVEQGKLAALLGPSGSGKTTILRMLAGLDSPDSGDIFIGGTRVNDIDACDRGVGFVFQNYALFRYMTVFDNIAFGLRVQKRPRAEIRERVEELLRLIGLEGLGRRYPNQLSGGQRQRVAFARALAPRPHLLLLDEPFAAIDAKLRKELRSWLREMILRVGITSIFVTHDQEEAIEVADQIIVTNHGRIERSGTARELYRDPQTAFAARFLGQSEELDDVRVLRGYEAHSGPALLRPENVRVSGGPDGAPEAASQPATVLRCDFRGSVYELELALDGTPVTLTTARSGGLPPLTPGERVAVRVRELFLCQGERVVPVRAAE